eukprot:COSAG02_NODE_2448_length_8837_cov_38.266880_11_plen_233_part_00
MGADAARTARRGGRSRTQRGRGAARRTQTDAARTWRGRGREVLTMSFTFHVGTPVNWLREARGISLGCTVRIVLLTASGEFPAGYVGRLARAGLEGEDSNPARVTLTMYQCSLMDETYEQIVLDGHEPTKTVTVQATDAWPLFDAVNQDLVPSQHAARRRRRTLRLRRERGGWRVRVEQWRSLKKICRCSPATWLPARGRRPVLSGRCRPAGMSSARRARWGAAPSFLPICM